MPDVLMRSGKCMTISFYIVFPSFTLHLSSFSNVMSPFSAHEKSSTSMHLEELDDPQKFADEGVKVITWQEYVSRLHELKDEIIRSWLADDRVTSLKLSIKVNFDVFNNLLCNIIVCTSGLTFFVFQIMNKETHVCFLVVPYSYIGF